MSYEIQKNERGVVIRGPLPIAEFAALSKVWSAEGFDTLHAGIAAALGVTMVITRKDAVPGWLAELERDASLRAQARGRDPEVEWLAGPHVGLSSLTIFSVLAQNRAAADQVRRRLEPFGPSMPLDPDDFSRCRRLLQMIPGWRARLHEVAEAFPDTAWPALVARWDTIEALYVEEEPRGRWPKTFRLMAQLTDAARKAARS